MAHTLVYTISTGRSGTGFLAALLKANLADAQVHHERANYLGMGLHSPDASHFVRFNSIGNVPEVARFWKQKLPRDAAAPEAIYAESSHLHCKAGLIENLGFIPEDRRVVLINLTRDPVKVAWSLHNRFQFVNNGYTWLFALDPAYRNVMLSSEPFRKDGPAALGLWYIAEMQTRGQYYKSLVADMPNVTFVDVALEDLIRPEAAADLISVVTGAPVGDVEMPPKTNAQPRNFFGDDEYAKLEKLVARYRWDAAALAEAYMESGRTLARPPWVTYPT